MWMSHLHQPSAAWHGCELNTHPFDYAEHGLADKRLALQEVILTACQLRSWVEAAVPRSVTARRGILLIDWLASVVLVPDGPQF
jgi:hypothetical protein